MYCQKHNRYEKELQEIEGKHAIRARWQHDNPKFKEVEVQFMQKKRFQLKQALRVSVEMNCGSSFTSVANEVCQNAGDMRNILGQV